MIPEGSLCFVDTETLGLEARRHVVWEFAGTRAIPVDDGSSYKTETLDFLIRVTPDEMRIADSTALRMTGFYDRYNLGDAVSKSEAAESIARFTAGCHMVAAVPSFDDLRLDDLLRGHGWAPAWHYHLVDIEAAASGYLRGLYDACREMEALGTKWGQDVEAAAKKIAMPSWNSNALSNAIGVQSTRFNRHTARGDVDWSIAIFEKVYGVAIR